MGQDKMRRASDQGSKASDVWIRRDTLLRCYVERRVDVRDGQPGDGDDEQSKQEIPLRIFPAHIRWKCSTTSQNKDGSVDGTELRAAAKMHQEAKEQVTR